MNENQGFTGTADGADFQSTNSFTSLDVAGTNKAIIRAKLVSCATKLLEIPYKFGFEWKELSKVPEFLDCSEMVEGVYKLCGLTMPDGSQNQFNFTVKVSEPKFGDLAFFGREGDSSKIYHVGIVATRDRIIEARAFDERASFETGKVILRPIEKWKQYGNFCGFHSHPDLI